jgi:hypothetical protein
MGLLSGEAGAMSMAMDVCPVGVLSMMDPLDG